MSLVGPRPLFEEDTLKFNENYMRRLNVLPGLTGLLQINERNTEVNLRFGTNMIWNILIIGHFILI